MISNKQNLGNEAFKVGFVLLKMIITEQLKKTGEVKSKTGKLQNS